MPYSKFSLPEAVAQFGLIVDYEATLFPEVLPVEPSDLLKTLLAEFAPLALAAGTEKARSEFIIAPLLAEVWRRTEGRISLFSGADFSVDPERGLSGFCDFLLSRSRDPYFIEAPVFAIIEAKNEDIRSGLGQCVASMVGAQIFNERKGNIIPTVYGAVTTGNVWRFLRLEQRLVSVDKNEEYLNTVERLLGVLMQIAAI